MSKKVFLALKISEHLQKKILEWKSVRKMLPVQWIQQKNLHITIIPPWHTDDTETVIKAFHGIKGKFGPIGMKFNRITPGPALPEPKLLWIEGETPGQILKLKTYLENILQQKPKERGFRLHVTIAKFRKENSSAPDLKDLDETVDWEENANTLLFMESHQTPEGSDYEIIAETPL